MVGEEEVEMRSDDESFLDELIALAKEAQIEEDVQEPIAEGRAVAWDDVLPIARRALNIWSDGGEMTWGAHAWAALTAAGLTRAVTEADRARIVCRLLALAVLYQQFCAHAFEEGYRGKWTFDAVDVFGEEEPYVHPFVLGQLAERDGIDADTEVGYAFDGGTPAYALRALARNQYDTVVGALRDQGERRHCSRRCGRPSTRTPRIR
jgi:hypothetical protein